MSKKIVPNMVSHQAAGLQATKEKKKSGKGEELAHEHEAGKHKQSSAQGSSRRHHAHRAMNAKGMEHAGEEIDHHDLSEAEARAKEAYEVRQTVQGQKDRDDQDDSQRKDSQAQRQLQARRQVLRSQGNLLVQKGKAKKKVEHPQVAAAKRDGFERLTAKKLAEQKKVLHAKLEVPEGPRIPPEKLTDMPHYLLKDVRDEGEFFFQVDEDGQQGGQGHEEEQQQEEEIDPEWVAAVEEMRVQLQGVRGVTDVSRGLSDDDERVVLVITTPGLTQSTFEKLIPSEVRGFATLTAIPFEALPLRRDRPLFAGPAAPTIS